MNKMTIRELRNYLAEAEEKFGPEQTMLFHENGEWRPLLFEELGCTQRREGNAGSE